MQFHPTTLYIPGARRFLLTEALRGEGARLLDATPARRAFAKDYHPDGELAPRDVVSGLRLGRGRAKVRVRIGEGDTHGSHRTLFHPTPPHPTPPHPRLPA